MMCVLSGVAPLSSKWLPPLLVVPTRLGSSRRRVAVIVGLCDEKMFAKSMPRLSSTSVVVRPDISRRRDRRKSIRNVGTRAIWARYLLQKFRSSRLGLLCKGFIPRYVSNRAVRDRDVSGPLLHQHRQPCAPQVELDAAIKSLSVVAAAPELYPALVDAGAVTSLLGLLTHENTVSLFYFFCSWERGPPCVGKGKADNHVLRTVLTVNSRSVSRLLLYHQCWHRARELVQAMLCNVVTGICQTSGNTCHTLLCPR